MSNLELFRTQAQLHIDALIKTMRVIEWRSATLEELVACELAARSLKGLASLAGLHASANLAQVMEECFAAAQRNELELHSEQIELLLQAVDLFDCLGSAPQAQYQGIAASAKRREQ